MGKDAGSLYIKGIIGSFEDTVEIEDLFYYNPNMNNVSLPIQLPETNLEISWILKPTARSSCFSFLVIDENSTSTGLAVGQGSSDGPSGFYWRKSSVISTQLPLNVETEVYYSYNNGTHTFSWGNHSVTVNSTAPSKIVDVTINNNQIKEFKIHEL